MTRSAFEFDLRARRIRLVLLDVDGVLTDGTIFINSDGTEGKPFFVRDGAAIVWARRAGLDIGLLSGRPSEVTTRRAAELGIARVWQEGPDKRIGFDALRQAGLWEDAEIAFMGDDLADLPILGRVGLSAAPADAAPEVRSRVDFVSEHAGGRGAVRDFLERILRGRGEWHAVVERHLA